MWFTRARSNRYSPGPARLAPGVRATAAWSDIGTSIGQARRSARWGLLGRDRSGAAPLPPGPGGSQIRSFGWRILNHRSAILSGLRFGGTWGFHAMAVIRSIARVLGVAALTCLAAACAGVEPPSDP